MRLRTILEANNTRTTPVFEQTAINALINEKNQENNKAFAWFIGE